MTVVILVFTNESKEEVSGVVSQLVEAYARGERNNAWLVGAG
jgi:hypothetical protein